MEYLASRYSATEYPSLTLNRKKIFSLYPEITINDLDFLSPTPKKSYSEDDLIQFHKNNLLCFEDNALFYLHLKKNHRDIKNILRNYPHDLDFPYATRLWQYFIFTGQQGFELLEPIWSEFERRFHDLLFHGNYDFVDSEDLSTCQEVIILRSLRLVRIPDSHAFKIYIRQGADWEELDHKDSFDFNWVIKSRDFFSDNVFFSIDEIYKLISQIVLADMFNMPKLIHSLQKDHIEKHYPNSYQAITQIVEVFAKRLYTHPSNENKVKNPSTISKYHLAVRLKKLKWVISNFFDPLTCKVFFQNPFNRALKITDYLKTVQDIEAYREDIEFWDSDNPIKTTFLLNTFAANSYAALKNHSILSFDNVLFHKAPSNHTSFWDKRCFKRTFTVMKKSMLQELFKRHTQEKKSFLMWSYWIGYSKYKKMNSHVFSAVVYFLRSLVFTAPQLQHSNFKNFLAKSCLTLDLLYEYLLQVWNKNKRVRAFSYECAGFEVIELVDYVHHIMSVHIRNIDTDDSINDIKVNRTTTVNRLKQLSSEWHQSVWMARFEGDQADYEHLTPFSTTVRETRFTLIQNNYDLYREGAEQRHCVYSFDNRVQCGLYVVFKVESEFDRATLGVNVVIDHQDQEKSLRYHYHQCLGRFNGAIKEQTQEDVDAFVQELNQQKHRFFHPALINHSSHTLIS